MSENLYIQLSGCPFHASTSDVAYFLAGCDIKGGKSAGVKFLAEEGDPSRASGVCFVNMLTREDVKLALDKNKQNMGKRWIEVVEVDEQTVEDTIERQGLLSIPEKAAPTDFVVKLRGLPWSANVASIAVFFAGCDLKGGKTEAIHIIRNESGKPTGEAYVELLTAPDKERALQRHNEYMGSRYVEVSKSTKRVMEKAIDEQKQNETERDAIVKLRGLPWKSTEHDIEEFFSGLDIKEVQIVYAAGSTKPMGEAFVEFNSLDDCDKGLARYGYKIGSRYIEIFQSSRDKWTKVYTSKDARDRAGRDVRVVPNSQIAGGRRERPAPYSRGGGRGGSRGDLYEGAVRQAGNRLPVRQPRAKLMSQQRAAAGYDGTEGYGIDGYDYETPSPYMEQPEFRTAPTKHCVIVKGISCDVSVGDIIKLFAATVQPKNVEVKFAPGSMVGNAVVELNTHADAMKAMLKDKACIDGVRVNLELKSKPEDYYKTGGYNAFDTSVDRYGSAAYSTESDPYMQTSANYSSSSHMGGGYDW